MKTIKNITFPSQIPVYKGCNNPILPRSWKRANYFHGVDGFGDISDLPEVVGTQPQTEHAVNFMYASVCQVSNVGYASRE